MYEFDVGSGLGLASGIALILLGAVTLKLRSRRPASRWFVFFAVLWGAQVATANVLRAVTDQAVLYDWAIAFVVLLVPVYFPLIGFVTTYPWSRLDKLHTPAGLSLLALPALLAYLVLIVSPSLFVEGVRLTEAGRPFVESGSLLLPLSATSSLLVFVVATAVVWRRLSARPEREERAQVTLLLAAFLLYLGNRASLVLEWGILQREFLLGGEASFSIFFLLGSLVLVFLTVLGVTVGILRRPWLRWRWLLVIGTLASFTVSTAGVFLRDAGVAAFDTVGLWRFAMVGLFAYAVARYDLFDVELRLRDAAPVAVYVCLLGAGLGVLWGGFGDLFGEIPALGATASLGIAAICYPSMTATDRLLDRYAAHLDHEEYLYKRKVEVYRAALEEAQAKGMGTETEELFLSDLRRRLGISEEEHRVLRMVLESQSRSRSRIQSPRPPDEKFEFLEELGGGSFGRARLVRDKTLNRKVVLKEPTGPWMHNEKGRDLFLREAKLAARMNHPNVVQIHEVLPDRDPPVLVLEYVDGGSLKDRIRGGGPIPPEQAVEVMEDVLTGLSCIHAEGMVHRDLKPANVLVTQEGTAKITDLGIAHPPDDMQMKMTLVADDSQPGTVAYMSPEQVRGEDVDPRTDLYAAGAVLYYLLTGAHYLGLEGDSERRARRRIVEEAPSLDDDRIPPPLETFLHTALAKRPEDRFPSAQAMAEALEERPPIAPPTEA